MAYAHADATGHVESAVESQLQETDHVSAFQAVDQNEDSPFPFLPEELPFGKTEGEEENTGKDAGEDDWSAHHSQVQALPSSLSLSASAYHLALSDGQRDIPLYVLFHCWRNFLI